MWEIPNFTGFKNKARSIINGVRTAYKNGPIWLIAYVVFMVILTIVLFLTVIGFVVSGLEAIGIIKENLYAPKKYLKWEKKMETQNEDGTWFTVFDISMDIPQGQGLGMIFTYRPEGCGEPKMVTSWGTELKNNATYSSARFESICNTVQKIAGDHELFRFKDN